MTTAPAPPTKNWPCWMSVLLIFDLAGFGLIPGLLAIVFGLIDPLGRSATLIPWDKQLRILYLLTAITLLIECLVCCCPVLLLLVRH